VRQSSWLLVTLLGAVLLIAAWPLLARHRSEPVVRASWTVTPGVLNPEVTQANIGSTICVRGWTKTVRPSTSYTNELKRKQLLESGLTGSLADFQEDHLISLELGGDPSDPRNLWPEPIKRATEVDRIENELNRKVCEGSLTLAEAQRRESQLKHDAG
jgi:hypothetical protein